MRLLKANDGVSESLGFVLIALILIIVMAAIIMYGYPVYQQSINEGHMQNMVEGFYLLSANANKVALYESPIQSSELQLYGGTLGMYDDGYISLSFRYYDPDTGADAWSDPKDYPLQVMEYILYNQKVVYLMGGVFKDDGNGLILLKEPITYRYTTGATTTIVLPIIENLNPASAITGSDFTRVEFSNPYYSREMGTLIYPKAIRQEKIKEIKIEMKSAYNKELGDYFANELLNDPPGGTTQASIVGGILTVDRNYDPSANTPPVTDITLYIPQCELYTSVK